MLRFVALCVLVFLPGACATPTVDDPQPGPNPRIEKIVAESLERGRSWDMLVELCTEAPHRLSGSKGAESAVAWAAETMREQGLENVRLEPCTVPFWERGELEELRITEPAELAGEELPILALGGSVETEPGGIEAEVVVVHTDEELETLGDNARGRIVLFNRPMKDGEVDPFSAYGGAVGQRSGGARAAAKHGAVAALVRSMTTLRDDVPHTGGMRYAEDVARIPAAAISTNAADRIEEMVNRGETVRLRLALSCHWNEPVESFNVVGELVGRERPEEIVVIGAHLDGWDVGQGAHDDGGGCVQVIEAVRILRALDLRPLRTIRVVLFMNEENGLAGGRAYAEAHAEDDHVLALESDRGVFTPRGFTTDAEEPTFQILRELAGPLAFIGAGSVYAGYGGADISPLAAHGVPLVGYLPDGQRYFDLHHSARDTLEQVNRRELELGAAAIAAFAFSAADYPGEWPR